MADYVLISDNEDSEQLIEKSETIMVTSHTSVNQLKREYEMICE
jgi:hypothetical protein